jgi:hypothetical protein
MSGSRRERQCDTVCDLSLDRDSRASVRTKGHVGHFQRASRCCDLGHSHLERRNPSTAGRRTIAQPDDSAVVQPKRVDARGERHP